MERPRVKGGNPRQVRHGKRTFSTIGCASCHIPSIQTNTSQLALAFPEVQTDPTANVYFQVELKGGSAGFSPNGAGGIVVPMYSDLKRHNMGQGLAETFGHVLDPMWVTARLWGIADTAPYLHDGRALTITDAILLHGGEGQNAADAFRLLPQASQIDLLAFLDTLKTPLKANEELLEEEGLAPARPSL